MIKKLEFYLFKFNKNRKIKDKKYLLYYVIKSIY